MSHGQQSEPVSSLYVHVPFCRKKCAYCAFYSKPGSEEAMSRYVAALLRELEWVAPELKPRTVFFGGGTPSLLSLEHWEQIFGVMDRLGLLGAGEWTIECNPATVTREAARLWRSFGVNRVSLGIQSLDDRLLETLGRIHDRAKAFRTFDLLRGAGFENVNLDLMFAIPRQTLEVWRKTLVEAAAMGSEHLSTYEVIYEEDTPLYQRLKASEFDLDEDLACAMYEELIEQAVRAGFEQYEVANFAKRRNADAPVRSHSPRAVGAGVARGTAEGRCCGQECPRCADFPEYACRHNVNYWRGGCFWGLGPSATSYVRGIRSKNWSNTERYCEQIERGERAIESSEELSPLARAGETAAFGLRTVAGWPYDEFQKVTGYDLREAWAAEMTRLVEQGWGRRTEERFQLTAKGLRFADAAAQLFLR
jgi:oxygen-independent coproporphyrinogen III oxidase